MQAAAIYSNNTSGKTTQGRERHVFINATCCSVAVTGELAPLNFSQSTRNFRIPPPVRSAHPVERWENWGGEDGSSHEVAIKNEWFWKRKFHFTCGCDGGRKYRQKSNRFSKHTYTTALPLPITLLLLNPLKDALGENRPLEHRSYVCNGEGNGRKKGKTRK